MSITQIIWIIKKQPINWMKNIDFDEQLKNRDQISGLLYNFSSLMGSSIDVRGEQ